jgi:hypothetical protein
VDAITELSAPRANRALVVDDGLLAGLLSITDLARALEVGRRRPKHRAIQADRRTQRAVRSANGRRGNVPKTYPSYGLTGSDMRENVSPAKPGDRKVGGLRHFWPLARYGWMPSLRSSTSAARRQRIVSGEKGSVNGIPFALRSGSPPRRTR